MHSNIQICCIITGAFSAKPAALVPRHAKPALCKNMPIISLLRNDATRLVCLCLVLDRVSRGGHVALTQGLCSLHWFAQISDSLSKTQEPVQTCLKCPLKILVSSYTTEPTPASIRPIGFA